MKGSLGERQRWGHDAGFRQKSRSAVLEECSALIQTAEWRCFGLKKINFNINKLVILFAAA
jgi:hypothetical protein